jgi:hypothetical protein
VHVSWTLGSRVSTFDSNAPSSSPAWLQIKYKYSCAKSVAPLSCRNVKTDETDDGGGGAKIEFLDRQNVMCEADEVLWPSNLTALSSFSAPLHETLCLDAAFPFIFA